MDLDCVMPRKCCRDDDCLWEKLGRPRMIVAPMVEASELAWRQLSRRHGAHLCYTPMLHSQVFLKDPKYRKDNFTTCPEDRPLIVQFCGNDASTIVKAAKMVEDSCDAIDINLGCPQAIAKRGHYGAFLMDEWKLISDIVGTLSRELKIPVTCKMRVYDDIEKTIEYARMLEAAGCKMLTVHGRTRDQKGPFTGLASWKHIRAVREALNIPVIANGNMQCLVDCIRCIDDTGCVGAMSAEGNLHNPFMFDPDSPPVWLPALEYLDLVELYPSPPSFIRGHLFKLFHSLLNLDENKEEREELAKAMTVEEFRNTVIKLQGKFSPYHEGTAVWPSSFESSDYNLALPPWICQPRVRIPVEEHLKKLAEGEAKGKENLLNNKPVKRILENGKEIILSKKKLKKLNKKPNHNFEKREYVKCSVCPNPVGMKCEFKLCKTCCRKKCQETIEDCPGHRILMKTKRDKSENQIDGVR